MKEEKKKTFTPIRGMYFDAMLVLAVQQHTSLDDLLHVTIIRMVFPVVTLYIYF